jgi:hypothetical protein
MTISTNVTPDGLQKLKSRLGEKAEPLARALQRVGPKTISLESVDRPYRQVITSSDFGAAYFEQAFRSVRQFKQESDALLPMTRMRREMADEPAREAEVRAAVTEALADPEFRDVLLEQQARTVDVTMQRVNADKSGGPFLTMDGMLVADAPYRIRVQIGRRSAVSIVSGDVPPIDLLLPPPEKGRQHILSIALYTDDFDLASPILQRVELPEIGPSPPVNFEVRTRQGVTRASARIAVYYDLPPDAKGPDRNHLIQSFLLSAGVRDSTQSEENADSRGIVVTLEFSLEDRLSRLEKLTPRLISLALNDDGTAGSHKLMMKSGASAVPVRFTEKEIEGALKSIRDTFTWASHSDTDDGARFPADQEEGTEQDFEQVIWRLADSGHVLFDELFGRALNTELEASLTASRQRTDDRIQAVHLALNFAFPWTVIYDFPLPPTVADGKRPPICKGFRRRHADESAYSCRDCLADCLHPDKREAVCVFGFWGTRHQVEQLLSDKMQKPDALRPIGPGAVAFTMGLTGTYVQQIPNDLASRLGTSAREIKENEDLLSTLWSDKRPAVVLLVGHYMTADKPGHPRGPRLTMPGQNRFLQPGDVYEKRRNNPSNWSDPRSVVLLAACSGGVVDITSVRNFVNVFTGVGAGAVVGPETLIYEGLARQFAIEMSEALVNGVSVGAAVVQFRRNLLRKFNPLGLVFTPYGFADLAAPSTSSPGS